MTSDRLACPCCGVNGCRPELLEALARLEAIFGPLQINSAYRCQKHNASLKNSAPGSRHVLGLAIDAQRPRGVFMLEFSKQALISGFYGIGIGFGDTFAHFDIRPAIAKWRYDAAGNKITYS